ncbi:MAG: hypothetical protein M1338_00765 [Patescibacteria group bacterium]|nr:hypothetical protein [Patescibacteria group bacterium]
MSINRLTPWISAVLVFLSLELTTIQPKLVYFFMLLSFMAVFVGMWRLIDIEMKKAKFWNFLITPILFLIAGWIFFIFLDGVSLQRGSAIFLAGFLWLFMETIFFYFHLRPKYQAHALENISNYLNLATVFLFYSGLFNLSIFLTFKFWWLILSGIIFSLLLLHELFWVSEISFQSSRVYIVIITLLIAELFWTVSFLPTSVYVNGMIMAILFYLLGGLARNWLLEIRESKVLRRYLFNSLFVFIIILLTAKWF